MNKNQIEAIENGLMCSALLTCWDFAEETEYCDEYKAKIVEFLRDNLPDYHTYD